MSMTVLGALILAAANHLAVAFNSGSDVVVGDDEAQSFVCVK